MIPKHKGEIPVVILLIPFICGIAFGYNFLPHITTIGLIAALGFLSTVFVILNRFYFRLLKIRWLSGLTIHLVLFFFGWALVTRHDEQKAPDHFSKAKAQSFIATLTTDPVLKNGYYHFTAAINASADSGKISAASGNLLVLLKDSSAGKLKYGDRLLIPAKYAAVQPPLNPAEFNYKTYLAQQNIHFEAFLFSKQYRVIDSNKGNPLIAAALKLRRQMVLKLKRQMNDTVAVAVASAMILGYKTDLSQDVREVYAKTGTIYILTVAGTQIALIYLLLNTLLSFLRPYHYGKVLIPIIIIAIIWSYALLTGFSVPVCRAALMVSFVVTGRTFGRYINTLNLLAAAAFVLLVIDPSYLAEPGFQLSFLAVAGLTLFQPLLYSLLTFRNKWAAKIWALCCVSIAAQLVLLPLCAFYFHELPLYFLPANLFVAIPATIVIVTGAGYLLLPQVPVISGALAAILEKTIVWMNDGLAWIQKFPVISINKIWITVPECLLLMIAILAAFFFLNYKKARLLQLALLTLFSFCVSISIKKIRQCDENSIAWLNLKKHTGIVFKNGKSALVLSDLPDTDKNYRYSIQPYLDSCQVADVKLVKPNSNFSLPWIKGNSGLVQYKNIRIALIATSLMDTIMSTKVNVDYIYLTGNPKLNLAAINNNVNYRNLVIDGSNSDRSIVDWQARAPKDVQMKLLKRNKSFVSVSNKK